MMGLGAPPALGFPDGAPPAHTGGFGEPHCGECHFGGEAARPGAFTLNNPLPGYQPGRTYELALRLREPHMPVGGFQLSVRFAEGPRRGRPAGRFDPGEDQALQEKHGIHYLGHGRIARRGEAEEIRWRIRWTAPDDGRDPVVFHGAAVAGIDDASPVGGTTHRLEQRLPSVQER